MVLSIVPWVATHGYSILPLRGKANVEIYSHSELQRRFMNAIGFRRSQTAAVKLCHNRLFF